MNFSIFRNLMFGAMTSAFVITSCTQSRLDVQAHRGGAGLMPENTTEAMVHAMNLGVTTLELDVVLTKDKQVVLSHNHFVDTNFIQYSNGSIIDSNHYLLIKDFDYSELSTFDLGSKFYKKFPEQKKIACSYPLLSEMIHTVENYCELHKIEKPNYNIEIKSWPSFYGERSFDYTIYSDVVAQKIVSLELGDRVNIQSFDVRCLEYLQNQYPELILSYLVDKTDETFDEIMSHISFVPEFISPHYSLVDKDFLQKSESEGIVVVPWTVDDKDLMRHLIDMGVPGIISNYPDRLIEVLSE